MKELLSGRTLNPHGSALQGGTTYGSNAPLSKTVRNREYLHLIQPYNFSPRSPLSMASICSNYSLAAIAHLIYILFKVIQL